MARRVRRTLALVVMLGALASSTGCQSDLYKHPYLFCYTLNVDCHLPPVYP